ncbi:Protein of unknown function DUF247, plant [Dillenia turbinata]|uniref:Uncharacterized protein n=1 Tax=Dillenia turbinata TaxID=194707 RepID=A0AAN8YU33_9MAGN
MEEQKLHYLENVFPVKYLVLAVKNWEAQIRTCYVDTIELNSNDFVQMVFSGCCFIIEIFLRNWFDHWDEGSDAIHVMSTENQRLFFVLRRLYDLAFWHNASFRDLPFHASAYYMGSHILDYIFLRNYFINIMQDVKAGETLYDQLLTDLIQNEILKHRTNT